LYTLALRIAPHIEQAETKTEVGINLGFSCHTVKLIIMNVKKLNYDYFVTMFLHI